MSASLDNLSFVGLDDVIGVPDSAQTMGDDETRSPLHQAKIGILDAQLGAGIYWVGGFGRDLDTGVGEPGQLTVVGVDPG